MQAILTVAIIIVCVLLIIVVLIQNSKGGGISSNFSAANQIMGVRRGNDVIEKATWSLAILLLLFSLLASPKKSKDTSSDSEGSITKQKASGAVIPVQQQAPSPAAAPQAPPK